MFSSAMMYNELMSMAEQLEGEELEELLATARDWALTHGLVMRSKKEKDEKIVTLAPFTLLPSPVDEPSFHKAIEVQKIFNLLYHKVAHDFDFLENTLAKTIEHDDFTRRLFEIHKTVKKEGYTQPLSLGLLRSDYLPDTNGNFKQVEMNTIASSMAGLIAQVDAFHRFILSKFGCDHLLISCPENNALSSLSSGLVDAWGLYGSSRAVILFVTEEETINIADQRALEFEIFRQKPKVRVQRRSFSQLLDYARIGITGELLVDEDEIAVVYFRTGYDPKHYVNEECWNLRLLIERSRAIKCPSIHYHLAGTKKIQQVLTEPGVVEKYISQEHSVVLVREMFVDIYPLDESERGKEGYRLALTEPAHFVLKPQREGGGNNIYGTDIPPFLQGISREDASSYILMRLINPLPTRNIILRADSDFPAETVSELGVYGVVIGDEVNVMKNSVAGHMLRTKEASSKEVGVAAGFGALDSPFLV